MYVGGDTSEGNQLIINGSRLWLSKRHSMKDGALRGNLSKLILGNGRQWNIIAHSIPGGDFFPLQKYVIVCRLRVFGE